MRPGAPLGFPRIWRHKTLFETFSIIAEWTWRRRGQAKRSGLPFGEETITESVLLDLQTAEPDRIKIVPFTKHQEARTGADWEWCFFDSDQSSFFPVRVQAKLLDDRDHTYSHLNRCIGNSGVRQIDQLRASKISSIYVFYNHLSVPSRAPASCRALSSPEAWGCSFALADAVLPLAQDKTFDSISKVSQPWACLVCCGSIPCGFPPGRRESRVYDHTRLYDYKLPFAAYQALRSLASSSRTALDRMELSNSVIREISEPTREAPSYFRFAVTEEMDDATKNRLAAEYPTLAGVVLVGRRAPIGPK